MRLEFLKQAEFEKAYQDSDNAHHQETAFYIQA